MNLPFSDTGTAIAGSLSTVADPDSVAAIWRGLEPDAECSFFLSWGWIGPWTRAVRSKTPLYLYTCRKDDRIVGLAFFTQRSVSRRKGLIRSRQLQLNEFNAPSCDMIIEYNGILCVAGLEQACWNALPGALRAAGVAWDELAARSLTAQQAECAQRAFPTLKVETDRALHSWAVQLAPEHCDEEKLLTLFKRKTRQQMRQSLREYEKLGPITIDVAADVEQALAFFEAMEVLHSARWQKAGLPGSFVNDIWTGFHRAVIAESFARGEIQLTRVCCNGEPIGYVYGFPWRGRLYALQTGFKPEQSTALRSGYVTHFRAMQHNATAGTRHYDFLPDEASSYKRLLAEPEQVLSTMRYQRPRLKFRMEQLLIAINEKNKQRRQAAASNAPVESDDAS